MYETGVYHQAVKYDCINGPSRLYRLLQLSLHPTNVKLNCLSFKAVIKWNVYLELSL